jgi:hypothetical protein
MSYLKKNREVKRINLKFTPHKNKSKKLKGPSDQSEDHLIMYEKIIVTESDYLSKKQQK